MSEKDIQNLMDLAKVKLEEAKQMTKTEAIRSLNHAGILTTKGEFKKDYQPLEEIVDK
ncbi:hypothetical protein QF042_002214 [Pedobacter sp. W3I1]|jgi:hypothetical protein|uniref:hypothetical protein n=1 Tax=Pedobacter sp. W3I1 TaxID=3042291 RepID=UPI002780327C|nr:hypothetical protein [Pedobacter sp. W3I1]MDQ0638649.1 hypothetical protein [Pedobacter sp. W3I1]